jgi:hypothetical protein
MEWDENHAPHAYLDVDGDTYVMCYELHTSAYLYAHTTVNLEALYG